VIALNGTLRSTPTSAIQVRVLCRPMRVSVPPDLVSSANVPKSVPIEHENGPRRVLRGPFRLVVWTLVAGTGFEPATSGL
jgi:hypothetical protein